MKIEPVGFISGKTNTETYIISGLEVGESNELKDKLWKDYRIFNRWRRSRDSKKCEIVFDMSPE